MITYPLFENMSGEEAMEVRGSGEGNRRARERGEGQASTNAAGSHAGSHAEGRVVRLMKYLSTVGNNICW